MEWQINFKYRDIPEKLNCEYCGTEIYDFEDPETSPYKECPHVIFIYMWADPDAFIYARKDYAEKIIQALLGSDLYKSIIADEEAEQITNEEILEFCNGQFEPLDSVSTKVAGALSDLPEKQFPQLLPPGTIVYKDDRYHSGVRIAVTSQAAAVE